MSYRHPVCTLLFLLMGCASIQATDPQGLRVAACQILVDGDREATFKRIELALAAATADDADIACFPEACLLGWVNPTAHQIAGTIPGPSTERLGHLARKYRVMISLGLAEQRDGRLHNSAVLIGRDGTVLLTHRKRNILGELMDPPYVPGTGQLDSTVETEFGRIGLLICADTFDQANLDALASAQPDLVLVPFGWAAPHDAWPQHGESLHSWIAHTARSTMAPTLGVDSVGSISHGPWKGFVLGGQSAFSDADGRLATALADREVEVRVFDVQTPVPSTTP